MKYAAVQLDEVAAKREPVFLRGGGEAGFGQHGSEAGVLQGHSNILFCAAYEPGHWMLSEAHAERSTQ
jgi:hypothetical protein